MEITEFKKDFLEEVKATASVEGEGSDAAFVNIATSYLIGAEVFSDFTPSFYFGKGRRNRNIRVDGYLFDEFDKTLNLVIADYTGDEDRETLTKTVATSYFDRLMYFIEEVYEEKLKKRVEPSTPVSDLISDMVNTNGGIHERIQKFRLFLLTDGVMSNRIHEIESREYQGLPVECQIWDVDRIFRVCYSDGGKEAIEIDFKEYTSEHGIPCIEASSAKNDDYKSYLCIIPGKTLADIYDHYGSQLLEGNVRSFLSTKVAVNKKIRETILSMPQNFFAYNNGVSATARDLEFELTSEGRVITFARDFQIINGGQTTASLSNARFKDKAELDDIYVQMKLTEIDTDEERATELVRNISRSSNSQNKVSDADFFATHPFHIRMEQISRRIYAPAVGGAQQETKWFYERARGQYLQSQMRMTKSQKDKFVAQCPKKQLIKKTDLAKYRNTWDGNPHIVSKGAQTNFMKYAEVIDNGWQKSDSKYNDKYYKDSVALAILFKHTENLVSHQSWYEQGYRANIVTYSLALLHKLIKEQYKGMDLDLQLVWNKQEVPQQVTNELIKITKYVFDSITDPNRKNINVTQWCKQEACWKSMANCDIVLSADITNVLLGKEEEKISEKYATQTQNLLSEVEVITQVLEYLRYNKTFWKDVRDFAMSKHIGISPTQNDGLKKVSKATPDLPSKQQAFALMDLLKEVKANGFKGQ